MARRWARKNLDRTPSGAALARGRWRPDALRSGDGLIHAAHRDDCARGLLRTADGVKLCGGEDGRRARPAIADPARVQACVAFVARRSDRACSGMESAEAVFLAIEECDRCNPRLTRAHVETFLAA
jgi:hypothetical protein